jgi:hypothetical protein
MSFHQNNFHHQNKPSNVGNMVLPITGRQIADMVYLMENLTVSQRRELLVYGRGMINNQSESPTPSQVPVQQQPVQQSNDRRPANNNNYRARFINNNDDSNQPRYMGKKKYDKNQRYQNKKFQQRAPKNDEEYDHEEGQEQEEQGNQSQQSNDWANATDDTIDDIPLAKPTVKAQFKKKEPNQESQDDKKVKLKRRDAPQPSEVVQEAPKEDLAM